MLPSRGKFTFPSPYNTEGVRITNGSDCGGSDCVNYVGYSYWRNMNNHVGQDTMLIFLGLDRSRGGSGPTLFEYNKVTDQVRNLGPLFNSSTSYSYASGEGWYFSATKPTKLYMNNGPRILRYDVITGAFETVFDVSSRLNNVYLHQMHSSSDDRVHSATVRASGGGSQGCMVYFEDNKQFKFFPRKGDYDECQVDKSGDWLVIKENIDGANGEDNRVVNLRNFSERTILDPQGAGGHSDMGNGYMVASDNWGDQPNTHRLWKFDQNPLNGVAIYNSATWGVPTPSHLSHSNAKPGVPADEQIACGSSASNSTAPGANEVICFRLDRTRDVLVVAPVMTDMNTSGGRSSYAKAPKGNLDITGEYFLWTSNAGGSRLDAFIVKVPTHKLGVAAGSDPITEPEPSPDPTPEPAPAPVPSPEPDPTPDPVGDTAAPVISNANATLITSTSAVVNWTSSEPAESMVEYGATSAYSHNTPHITTLLSGHVATVSNLVPGTEYHYRVHNRDAAGNIASSEDLTFKTLPVEIEGPGVIEVQPVAWTRMINVRDRRGVLSKVSGCDGCPDGGASSRQQIDSGDGYVEFTATIEKGRLRFLGLSRNDSSTDWRELDFALRLQDNLAEVRERGRYRSDIFFSQGDTFRIAVDEGEVTYAKNGRVFYTSRSTPRYPLTVDTALLSMNGSFTDAVLGIPGTAAPQTPLGSEGLVARWMFEDTGLLALDMSGNGHNGSLVSSPVWSNGAQGGAMVFDGVDDYVDIPHQDALDSFPLSVSLWVKTDATGLHGLVNKYVPSSFNGYQVFVNNGSLCAWYFRDASNYIWDHSGCTLSTSGINDNEWHHVAFTVDANGGKLYLDGVETARESWTGNAGPATSDQALSLGRYPQTSTPYFSGALGDVRIYDRTLSATEVTTVFQDN
ncbi:MAG: LamG-like jellyroll fold domain-containing protein [Pseudohongiellaceae bacterium]